jgi:hypothetical protein
MKNTVRSVLSDFKKYIEKNEKLPEGFCVSERQMKDLKEADNEDLTVIVEGVKYKLPHCRVC